MWVKWVLKRTVGGDQHFNILRGSHLQRQVTEDWKFKQLMYSDALVCILIGSEDGECRLVHFNPVCKLAFISAPITTLITSHNTLPTTNQYIPWNFQSSLDSEQRHDFHSGCWKISQHQQSFLGLTPPWRSNFIQVWFQTIFYYKKLSKKFIQYQNKRRKNFREISHTIIVPSSFHSHRHQHSNNLKTNLLQAIFPPLQHMTQTMVNQVCLL